MKNIDEQQLESDLGYRVGYLQDFIGFGQEDIDVIHASAEVLAPLVPGLVDAVYTKLFTYDCTKRHFLPRQHGYEGDVPVDLESLTVDHEMIAFRKGHLTTYMTKLVTSPYDENMLKYLDNVGKMHTSKSGSKSLVVPLVQMNALMGFVADAFIATILGLGLDRDTEIAALRAFSKLLWIQNDLINRHYQEEPVSV